MAKNHKYRFDSVALLDSPGFHLRFGFHGREMEIPLFPSDYAPHEIIPRESSVDFWKSIFRYYGFSSLTNEFGFISFFRKTNDDVFGDILAARSYSVGRFKEIKNILALPEEYSRLFMEKSIAPKYIEMVYLHQKHSPEKMQDSATTGDFLRLLSDPMVNKNTATEIIIHWTDMTQNQKLEFSRLWETPIRPKSPHRIKYADHMLQKCREIRFPEFHRISGILEDKLKKIRTRGLKLEASPNLENNTFTMTMEISSEDDPGQLCAFLEREKNQIKELFDFYKRYDNKNI